MHADTVVVLVSWDWDHEHVVIDAPIDLTVPVLQNIFHPAFHLSWIWIMSSQSI